MMVKAQVILLGNNIIMNSNNDEIVAVANASDITLQKIYMYTQLVLCGWGSTVVRPR